MIAEIVLTGGNPSAGTPKAGLAYLHPAGAAGSVALDWGDGATGTLAFDGSGAPLTVSHEWATRGVYTIAAAVDGNVSSRAVTVR